MRPCRRFEPAWVLPALLMVAMMMTGCGGGGGGPPSTYAVKTAERLLLTQSAHRTLTGTAAGQSFTIVVDIAPLAAATFGALGTMAARSAQTITVQQGTTSDSTTVTTYFDIGSLAVFGTDNGDGTCSVATANTVLPDSAAAGAGGAFYTLSDTTVCTPGAMAVSTTTTGWTLESDSGVTLLCLTSTVKDLSGTVQGVLSNCVEVAADGTPGSRARLTISALGLTASARNF